MLRCGDDLQDKGWAGEVQVNAEERRFAVLRAIVADYVRTQEPVGSKMIVDRHGGTITASSEEGKGATLAVRLPLHGAKGKDS